MKRELPICARLKISKAEIIIFRLTIEEKHFIVNVIDNSYIAFSKSLDITVNALLMPKVFFFFWFWFFRIYAKVYDNNKPKKIDNWDTVL